MDHWSMFGSHLAKTFPENVDQDVFLIPQPLIYSKNMGDGGVGGGPLQLSVSQQLRVALLLLSHAQFQGFDFKYLS